MDFPHDKKELVSLYRVGILGGAPVDAE